MKVTLLTIGKTKEKWLQEALTSYIERLPCTFEMILAKDREQLSHLAQKERRLILLDPKGKAMSSEVFSEFLMKELELGGAKVSFVVGDAEGLPEGLSGNKVSLSPLTFTHQMVRLILLEQLFRAFEIARGSPYHK